MRTSQFDCHIPMGTVLVRVTAELDAVAVGVGHVGETQAGDATVARGMDDAPACSFYFAACLVDVVDLEAEAGHAEGVVASLVQSDRGVAEREFGSVGRLSVHVEADDVSVECDGSIHVGDPEQVEDFGCFQMGLLPISGPEGYLHYFRDDASYL